MRQRKNTEPVEDGLSVRKFRETANRGFLLEESNDSRQVASVWAEFAECRGSEREFRRRSQTLVVVCPKHLRTLHVPLLSQSVGPHMFISKLVGVADQSSRSFAHTP